MRYLFLCILFFVALSTQAQVKNDTVYVTVDIPPTMEKNAIGRGKKMQELQLKFTELQEKFKEYVQMNKDDFSTLMQIGKVDSTKLFRDKNGNPLLAPKQGKLVFKLKH